VAELFTGQMPFLLPNEQHQCTEETKFRTIKVSAAFATIGSSSSSSSSSSNRGNTDQLIFL